jgi:hypothetical protein
VSRIVFLVDLDPDGGYTARALGSDIFTEADDRQGLRANVREALRCHFDDRHAPDLVRLQLWDGEVLDLRP